jgi:hypothetical protein
MGRITLADSLIMLGMALLFVGLAGYDWRVAVIVIGALLTIAGAFGIVRGG